MTEASVRATPPARRRAMLGIAAIAVASIAGAIVYSSTRSSGSSVTVIRSGAREDTEASPPAQVPAIVSTTTDAPTTAVTTTTTAPTTTTAAESTTTVAPTTTMATETTAPPTTAPPTTAPPTTAPATTSPPPVIAVATVDDLVAAVPQQADMPLGLALSGDPVDTAPLPASGPGAGYCGGDSAVQRAWNAAAVAIVAGAEYLTSPQAGYLSIDFYAFATPADAALFMSLSASQASSCLSGFQYQLPEGDGPGQYDGFADDYGLDAVWDMTETPYYSPTEVPGADDAFQLAAFHQAATHYRGTSYAVTETDATQYERHGQIVIVFNLYGACCQIGFTDIDPSLDYQPTTPELLNWVESLRPGIIARLQGRGVL